MNYDLPEIITIRKIAVRKRREGELVRIFAGPYSTTCRPIHAWEIAQLLVAAVEKNAVSNTCSCCGAAVRLELS